MISLAQPRDRRCAGAHATLVSDICKRQSDPSEEKAACPKNQPRLRQEHRKNPRDTEKLRVTKNATKSLLPTKSPPIAHV